MSSIIEGYEYDIFISYRQKDNKGERWVSEFVEALKTELESTFKEEISVYFDINPHDGLLETHDVDASLKEKLKCLLFIPVISRTYCDPKSFAWVHEFKAFVEQASTDRFGLKVKLPNGNVANRVLPVRIYDLDSDDIKLCEATLGGVLRGVEFIYHSQGVNRPLRQRDDDVAQSTKQLIYRDQINKVANAVDEIFRGLKRAQSSQPEKEIPVKETVEDVRKKKIKKILKTERIAKRKQRSSPGQRISGFKKWGTRILLILLFLFIPVIWYIWPFLTRPKVVPKNYESSIAVMLFEDVSDNQEFENFATGTTNDLISQLSRIQSLKVAPITESLRFKQQKSPTRAICKDLDVRMVLQGSLKVEEANITLTAELVDGEKDITLWNQNMIGKLVNILDIQDEIIREVVRVINDKYLTSKVKKQVGKRSTRNFKAYELYLKGNVELTKWTHKNIKESISFYEKAFKLDQKFVEAYANSALANLTLTYFFGQSTDVIESIKRDAKKALSLENDNETALLSMQGYYMMKILSGRKLSVFEYRDIIMKLKNLVSKNPTSPMALFGLAEYHRLLKKDITRASEYLKLTLTQCNRILQSDKSNGIILGIAAQSAALLGQLEFNSGQFMDAIKNTEYSIQLMPSIGRTYNQLAGFYFNTDQPQRAKMVMDQAISNVTDSSNLGEVELSQGRYLMIEGKFREAEQCWTNAMAHLVDPSDDSYDYAVLYRYIMLHRLKNSMKADTLLRDRLKMPGINSWTEPIMLFLTGGISEENLMRLANKNWRKCEAFFFLGEKCMINGDMKNAQKHFEECIKTEATNYYEYDMSKGELNRILKGSI